MWSGGLFELLPLQPGNVGNKKGASRQTQSRSILEVHLSGNMNLYVKVGGRFHSVEPESPCSDATRRGRKTLAVLIL